MSRFVFGGIVVLSTIGLVAGLNRIGFGRKILGS